MINRLFCYGTLMAPPLFTRISGVPASMEAATLLDYQRFQMKSRSYPGIVSCVGAEVQGCLYHGVGTGPLARLDQYEGDWYKRKLVTVRGAENKMVKAWCYVVQNFHAHKVGADDWCLDAFVEKHLRQTLAQLSFRNEDGVMPAQRILE